MISIGLFEIYTFYLPVHINYQMYNVFCLRYNMRVENLKLTKSRTIPGLMSLKSFTVRTTSTLLSVLRRSSKLVIPQKAPVCMDPSLHTKDGILLGVSGKIRKKFEFAAAKLSVLYDDDVLTGKVEPFSL